MILLADIGNTHTHLGLSDGRRITRTADLATAALTERSSLVRLQRLVGRQAVAGVCVCSVVPAATPLLRRLTGKVSSGPWLELTHRTVAGLGIRYPRPWTIGPDRLANAVAARARWGAPVVVVDFGTAVTFDVVDAAGYYIGGIIAPGLAAMTDYLHEKTALLPRITIRDVRRVVGKNTAEAMRIGAVHGYRGLVRELLRELKRALGCQRLPVAATGGYAALIARGLPEIDCVAPHLTLEGLRLTWLAHHPAEAPAGPRRQR